MAFCWICGNKYDLLEGQPITSKPEHKTYRICTTCQDQKNQLYQTNDPEEYIAYFEKYIYKIKDPVALEGLKEILAIPVLKNQLQTQKEEHAILKGCPCCGNPSEYGRTDSGYKVYCPNCALATKWCETAEEARTLWNRRVES